MAVTRLDRVGDGSTTIYDVSFTLGYLKREYVYVYLEENAYTDQLDYAWINNTQIELNSPIDTGVQFNIRRVVPRNEPVNDYEAGAILRESNLDDSFLQSLMILEEIEDGYVAISGDFIVAADIDMQSNRIINLAPAIGLNDAVTLDQMTKVIEQNTLTGAANGSTPKHSVASVEGWTRALFTDAGVTSNNVPDTEVESQRMWALHKLFDINATVEALAAGRFAVGSNLHVLNRKMMNVEVVVGGTPNGTWILDAGNGNTAEYRPNTSEGVNVLHLGATGDGVTDDDAAIISAVKLCKATGFPLVIPNGVYNAALIIDWCIPVGNRDTILADPRYNPVDTTQGTDVGLCFDVKMDSRAKFLKDSEISRVRGPVKMSLGQFQNKLIFCNLEKVAFNEGLIIDDVASMAYRSSNPTSDRYPRQWFYWTPNAELSNLSNGSCYWISFKNLDATKGFILGGTTDDGYATNVVKFDSCRLIGAKDIDTSGRESYIDNRGTGFYLEMTGGHTDGITLINCDLSYNTFPLWNKTNNPIQMIGCYYEACTNNFFTQDGVTSSSRAVNILNGFDYDRSNPNRNERTSLRANGFNISSRNGGGADYSSINIEPLGGSVYVKDLNEDTNIGVLQNTQGQAGKAGTLAYLGFINSAQADESVYSLGERTGFLFDKSWAFIDIRALAASASTSYNVVCTNTGANVNANGTIEVTVCGAPQGNTAGQPVVYKATVTKQGSGAWAMTPIYGSLTGERVSISFTSGGDNNNNLSVTVTNGAGSGSFTGTVRIETNITSSTRNPDGTYTRFRVL